MSVTDIEKLSELLGQTPRGTRRIIAVIGPPGSGKSTFADQLARRINAAPQDLKRAPRAAILTMDGFHYDNMILEAIGRMSRKGAPDTFDVAGLGHMLVRLRQNKEEQIAVPVFDRTIEIARASARFIAQQSDLIIVEGNYLLLNRSPWDALKPLFDTTIAIHTPLETLRQRLNDRWRDLGLADDEVQRRVEQNDLPNGAVVMHDSSLADFTIEN